MTSQTPCSSANRSWGWSSIGRIARVAGAFLIRLLRSAIAIRIGPHGVRKRRLPRPKRADWCYMPYSRRLPVGEPAFPGGLASPHNRSNISSSHNAIDRRRSHPSCPSHSPHGDAFVWAPRSLNLLSNAIKFTPEGRRIEILAAPDNGTVEVSVIDAEVGIAQEDHEAVFEQFRQVGTAADKVVGLTLLWTFNDSEHPALTRSRSSPHDCRNCRLTLAEIEGAEEVRRVGIALGQRSQAIPPFDESED